MDERFEATLQRGLIELIEPEHGGFPEWATSPAVQRVRALGPGLPAPGWAAWRDRLGARLRPAPRARLAWALATLGLLLLGLLAFAAVGGFDRNDERRPTASVSLDFQRSPALLAASGIDSLSADRGDYRGAVVDADGATIWLLGEGRLVRFEPGTGDARKWTIADDLAFAAGAITPARGGGVWLLGSSTGGRALRWFDGSTFRDVVEAPADVTAAVEAPDHGLWVATTDGSVHRWDGRAWSRLDDRAPLPDARITAIAVDAGGSVWIGWAQGPWPGGSGMVEHFDGVTWRTYDAADAPPLGGMVWTISPFADGTVWVATDAGLARFDGSTWSTFVPSEGGPRFATSAAAGPDGAIWVAAGDPDDGAVTVGRLVPAGLDGPDWTTYGPADGLPGSNETGWVTAWMVPSRDTVYVATGAGLLRLVGDRWERARPATPPVDPGWLAALMPVSRDEAWAGTEGGLWHFRDGVWSQYDDGVTADGGGAGAVHDLEIDVHGNAFAATDAGVLRLADGRWTVIDERPAGAVAIGPDISVWVSPLEPGGDLRVLRFDEGRWSAIDVAAPPLGSVGDLAAGPGGTAWAIEVAFCLGGTARYDGARWESVQPPGGRVSAGWQVDVAPNGDAWFVFCGDENGGAAVARLSGSQWTVFSDADGIGARGGGDSLAIGPDGSVWVTGIGGLQRFDGRGWRPYFGELWFDSVRVAPDGAVWAVGTSGLVRFSPD